MIIKCPQCHEEIEVEQDWVGRKAKCPYCETKFVIENQDELDVPVSQWSYEELAQSLKAIDDDLKTVGDDKMLVDAKKNIAELEGEIKKRLDAAAQQADESTKAKLPVILRFLFPLVNKYRKKSKDEARFQVLGNEVAALFVKLNAAKIRKGEAREEAEAAEWAQEKNAELDAAVSVLIRRVRNAGLPKTDCDLLQFQPGEFFVVPSKCG